MIKLYADHLYCHMVWTGIVLKSEYGVIFLLHLIKKNKLCPKLFFYLNLCNQLSSWKQKHYMVIETVKKALLACAKLYSER